MIAKGCKKWVAVPGVISVFSFLLAVAMGQLFIQFFATALLCSVLAVFFLVFFRDPERAIPKNPLVIVSPADGNVMKIDSVGRFLRIAVFMNRHNVHVNRAPLSGKILNIRRIGGRKALAYKDYSETNERLVTQLKTRIGIVNIVQITGMFARRIESYVKKGQTIGKGERIGMIKLGSRCDVYLPKDRVVVKVKVNDKVLAGTTALAFIKMA